MFNVIIQTLNCPHVQTNSHHSQQLNYNYGLSDCLKQRRVHEISVQTELKWSVNLLQTLFSTMTSTTATTDCTLETYCVGKRSILANRQCVSPLITLRFHNYLVRGELAVAC